MQYFHVLKFDNSWVDTINEIVMVPIKKKKKKDSWVDSLCSSPTVYYKSEAAWGVILPFHYLVLGNQNEFLLSHVNRKADLCTWNVTTFIFYNLENFTNIFSKCVSLQLYFFWWAGQFVNIYWYLCTNYDFGNFSVILHLCWVLFSKTLRCSPILWFLYFMVWHIQFGWKLILFLIVHVIYLSFDFSLQ